MNKNISNLLVSILYLLLGVVFLIYKDTIFSTMKLVVGIGLLVVGLIRIIGAIIKRNKAKKLDTVGDFAVGLIIAIVGLLLILPVFDNAFAYAFGLFFIIDGVGKLINAFSTANTTNKGWWISLVIAFLILVAGVLVIVLWDKIVSSIAIFIGVILIVSGIQGIMALLTGKK